MCALATAPYPTRVGYPLDVEECPVVVGLADTAGQSAALVDGHHDKPVDVAAPVAWRREGAVDPGRRDLERVGPVTECFGLIQAVTDDGRGGGQVVQRDPAVLVDEHADDAAPANSGDLDGFDVETRRLERRAQHLEECLCGLVAGHWQSSQVVLSSHNQA